MGRKMGLDFGMEKADSCYKLRFRWLLKIPEISASGINSLPPVKSARPGIAYKEIVAEHLNETIYFPGKPDFKTLTVTLYDMKRDTHPIFEWIQRLYNPCEGDYFTSTDTNFKLRARLELYDGCGNTLETWVYENIWPVNCEFGELDMGSSEVITADLTMRYDRAFVEENC